MNYAESGKIAAMVSGGVDSMVMLDMLIRGNADVMVAHVNHHIRESADGDCKFVRDYCRLHNLPFVCYDYDIPSLSALSGRSLETEARLARKEVAAKLLEGEADKVALAHHADDNAETILMHILRGSGPDGLVGIRETERIIRPLLHFTRKEILDYAAANDIKYVTDETNFDPSYTRNFIRLEVMPLIKSRYPSAVETLNRLALNISDTLSALDSQINDALIKKRGDVVQLSLEALFSPLATRYVIKAAKMLMPIDVTRAQILGVINLASLNNGSKAELAGGLKAYREYDKITFCFDRTAEDFCLPFREGSLQAGNKTVRVSTVSAPIKGKTVVANVPNGSVFRRRREGDSFTPFGGGSKSLKKYLIDKKVPHRLRDELVLLCSGSEVLAIVGLEISEKCRVKIGDDAYLLEVIER